MIKFKTLKCSDTFSYTKLEFNFEPGLHNIQGVNGSSKTSLFMALIHTCFNRNPKDCKVDDINNKITGGLSVIEVTFSKGDTIYKIINSRKNGSISIFINNKDKSLKRIPDNLMLIQEILGADYSMLVDLVYQSKDSTLNLLETSTDKGRKDFIARILKLEEIDTNHARVKEAIKELEGKNGRIPALEQSIQMLKGSIAEELAEGAVVDTKDLEVIIKLVEQEMYMAKGQAEKQKGFVEAHKEALSRKNQDEATRRTLEEKQKWYDEVNIDVNPENVQKDLQIVSSELAVKMVTLSSLQKDLKDAEAQEAQVKLLLDKKEARSNMTLPASELDYLEKYVSDIKTLLASKTTTLKQIKSEYDSLKESTQAGKCPTCGHEVDVKAFDNKLHDLKLAGEFLKEELTKLKADQYAFETDIATWQQYNALTAVIEKIELVTSAKEIVPQTIRDKIIVVQQQVKSLEEQYQFNADLLKIHNDQQQCLLDIERLKNSLVGGYDEEADYEEVIQIASNTLEVLTYEYKKLQNDLTERKRSLEEVKEDNVKIKAVIALNIRLKESNEKISLQIDAMEKELSDLLERLELLKQWNGILGNKGYRVARINKFLKSLNATMKKYSEMVSGGRIQCYFFITPEGEIDFTITDDAKEMPYKLWSGGEKSRVKLVCLFAVLELLEVMGSVSFNVLCLDEVFSTLDMEGKEGLFKVLEYLKGKDKCIYTIAHEDIALDMAYDSVIKAEKLADGTTRIIQ